MRIIVNIFILCHLLSCLPVFAGSSSAYAHPRAASKPDSIAKYVVQWADKNLPHAGILTEEKDGFVYVKVSDAYIHKLYPFLKMRAYTKPPYFRRQDSVGAHITVFHTKERERTGPIHEIGRSYHFNLLRLSSVPSDTKKFIVLEVSAPKLNKLRQKYGLRPLINNHEFHITIAKKAAS